MTLERVLHWFLRLESWIALTGGALLLGLGGFVGLGIWAGTVELSLGSDLPKGALFAVAIGAVVLAFGYLFHRAAKSVRRATARTALGVLCPVDRPPHRRADRGGHGHRVLTQTG